MSDEEKFNKAVNDLTIATSKLRDVMNYLQNEKLSKLSFTEVEIRKTPWWKKLLVNK
jgi:hypothetical protein